MLNGRQLFQRAGITAVAGAGGAAWMFYGSRGSRVSQALAGGPFRHRPLDPVAAENANVMADPCGKRRQFDTLGLK